MIWKIFPANWDNFPMIWSIIPLGQDSFSEGWGILGVHYDIVPVDWAILQVSRKVIPVGWDIFPMCWKNFPVNQYIFPVNRDDFPKDWNKIPVDFISSKLLYFSGFLQWTGITFHCELKHFFSGLGWFSRKLEYLSYCKVISLLSTLSTDLKRYWKNFLSAF